MPFAGYKNFNDCVRKNLDKNDIQAYCATIMRKVEGEMKENINDLHIQYNFQVGSRVQKGSKRGQVISMNNQTAIVYWDGNGFKEEPLEDLKPVGNGSFNGYMRRERRI